MDLPCLVRARLQRGVIAMLAVFALAGSVVANSDVTVKGGLNRGGKFIGLNPKVFTPTKAVANAGVGGIKTQLNVGRSVTVTTASSHAGNGDLTVAVEVAKLGRRASTLSLQAERDLTILKPLRATRSAFSIELRAGRNMSVGAPITSFGGNIGIHTGEPFQLGAALNAGAGQVVIRGGSVESTDPQVITASAVSVEPGGALRARGSVTGNLLVAGTVSPGALGTADLQAGGDLVLQSGAVTELNLGGVAKFGKITAKGAVTLAGELRVDCKDGFEDLIVTANSFTVLAGSSITGTFDGVPDGGRVMLPDELGSLKVTYTATAVILSDWQPIITNLTWDPGTEDAGTEVFTNARPRGRRHYFRVHTEVTDIGAWRTRLTPAAEGGEADLHMRRGSLPSATNYEHRSIRAGADGFVLNKDQFVAAQEWLLLVTADPGKAWSLLSGRAYVQDLGTMPWEDADANGAYQIGEVPLPAGSGPVTIYGEGMRFFKATLPSGTPAWSLWLNGSAKSLAVRQLSVPFHTSSTYYDRKQNGQLLVVPPVLVSGVSTYFASVVGNPGDEINLDSRIQEVVDVPYDYTVFNITADGPPYRVYRVQVPVEQIAWDVSTFPILGNPNIAIRRSFVAAEFDNDAYAEVPGQARDSITVVPNLLTDGAWYITVYGESGYQFSMRNGPPAIAPLGFTDIKANDEPDRAGWKYFALTDIEAQLGAHGWMLELANQVPGTEIALRRNAVPSRWRQRKDGSATIVEGAVVDFSDKRGFLERPAHQPDVWYAGIYFPTEPLGNFVLTSRPIVPPPVAFDGGTRAVTDLPAGRWAFARVNVPAGVHGWDVRLRNLSGDAPMFAIRHDLLPQISPGIPLQNIPGGWAPTKAFTWPSGNQWKGVLDWTGYSQEATGIPATAGLVMPMGSPLEPGSYYLGVLNTSAAPISFNFESRGIGAGQSCAITNLEYAGGTAVIENLAPREARYFKTTIPPNTRSWEVTVDATLGEVLLMARRGRIADFHAAPTHTIYKTDPDAEQTKIKKIGHERYVVLPGAGDFLYPGDYYLSVVSEGVNPSSPVIGAETSSAVIRSLGPLAVKPLGLATPAGLNEPVALVAGQIKAYQFTVAPDTEGLEVRLLTPAGSPIVTIIPGENLPAPEIPSQYAVYGIDGGILSTSSTGLITAANPTAGTWSVLVHAPPGNDATAILNIVSHGPVPLAFDGGVVNVTEHLPGTWRYFAVQVPADAAGWDVRLRDVVGTNPPLMIRRDLVPDLDANNQPTFIPLGWRPHTYFNWPSGFQWRADVVDWIGTSANPDGSASPARIVAGMGRPLEAGFYYAGVYNKSGSPISYTIDSRGIGASYTYPVTNLGYAGGVAQVAGLAAREARYFRVDVPANSPSWEVTLAPGAGELEMLVRRDAIPDFYAIQDYSIHSASSGGEVEMRKAGGERYVLLPDKDQPWIPAGTYYVAVVSEGVSPAGGAVGAGEATAELTSVGPLAVKDLGVPTQDGTTEAVALEAGQIRAYKVTVPAGTRSLEARLDDPVGNPQLSLVAGEKLPKPAAFGSNTNYGWNSGVHGFTHNSILTVADPVPGTWTILVRGGHASASVPFGPSSAQLVVTALMNVPLEFDGGSHSIVSQQPNSWRYFSVEVPADALGWDVRLRDVSGAIPSLLVRRDQFPQVTPPSAPATTPGWTPSSASSWPTLYQWLGTADWTGYLNQAGNPAGPPGLVAAMGRPLEPGTYYIGVYNNRTTPTSYTVWSRGIGAGRHYDVTELPFAGGAAEITELQPREPKYFRVTIPESTPSWELSLGTTLGDLQVAMRRSYVPDFHAPNAGSLHVSTQQMKIRKDGGERFLLLPDNSAQFIPAGDYYVAVVSDGVNPNRTNNIVGTGTSSGVVTSHGTLPITDLGPATVAGVLENIELASTQTKGYVFDVPAGTDTLEIRLENSIGHPEMTVFQGKIPAPPSIVTYGGSNGGVVGSISKKILTFVSPKPGPWHVMVRATEAPSGPASELYPDATVTLSVRQKPNLPLNFDVLQNANGISHTDTKEAIDNEYHIYKVTPPSSLSGQPVLGWIIKTELIQGAANVRVFKDFANPASGVERPAGTMVVVPPYLTFDEPWYVQVRATGTTHYRITSRALTLERPVWQMPEPHNLTFGDSGNDAAGNPLPDDRGIDLERGAWHFFAVDVPENNRGLLRTELHAISGNPDLYIREDGVPTTDHLSAGTGGNSLIHRTLTGSNTSYGNWVPISGRTERNLRPGRWYLGVRAGSTSNVRYRLLVSTGSVRELALNQATATAELPREVSQQVLADNDWRYYSFTVPKAAPKNWTLTFGQTIGDVVMHIRDTVPPGQKKLNSTSVSEIADHASDNKNQGPYAAGYDLPDSYTIDTPPLRPGHTYYVGFRSKNSATFTLSSSTSNESIESFPVLDFYTGSVDTVIPAQGSVMYRLPVPPEGTRFKYSATHVNTVSVRIEQGTLADGEGTQHFASTLANSSQNVALSTKSWPWQPGQDYYVRLVNKSLTDQAIQLTLNGKNAQTEDEDNDGLLDAWELQFFPNLSNTPGGDADGDGVTNGVEYADGTAPNDSNSAKYALTVVGRNGDASVTPIQAKYDRGTVVSLSSVPKPGHDFICWAGAPLRTDDFAIKATGTITLPEGGVWTFGVHSGDGVRVLVNGVTVINDANAHEPRAAFGQITLAAGSYPIEIVAFERTGGESLELFAAPGSHTAIQPEFRLVGDTANGGIPVNSVVGEEVEAGFLVRQVALLAGTVSTLGVADSVLASTASSRLEVTGIIDTINFLDFSLYDGYFGDNAHFPLTSGIEDQPMELAIHGTYTISALHSLPLETGTDAANIVWDTAGSAPWMAEEDAAAFDGVDLAGSGPVGDNQTSVLQATVQGPGTLTFRWRVSSQLGDSLIVGVNGGTTASITGNTAWALRTINIPAGTHRVTWSYTKNTSGSALDDRGYVDQVTFTP